MAVYGDQSGATDWDWLLFCVTQEAGETVYPILASARFRPGFSFVRDGSTRYRSILERTGPTTVGLQLPDGEEQLVDDGRIAEFWGDAAGFQLRRPFSTDGYAEFTAVATAR